MSAVDPTGTRLETSWWPEGQLTGEGPISPVKAKGLAPPLLALHGFGATPNEVLMLMGIAEEFGLARSAPLLPGHGTHARDLARTVYADWYKAAEREFLELAQQGPVIVAGQSMGGVLALDLASRHPAKAKAVAVLATATRLTSPYPNYGVALAPYVGLGGFFMPKFGGPNIRDPEAKSSHVTYNTQPIAAAAEVRRAGLRVLGQLSRIGCPAFIAHGKHDGVCPVANAWEIAERLGTCDKELVILEDSAHIVTKDHDRKLLEHKLRGFVGRVVALARPAVSQRPVEP